jgi:hypothetical protein
MLAQTSRRAGLRAAAQTSRARGSRVPLAASLSPRVQCSPSSSPKSSVRGSVQAQAFSSTRVARSENNKDGEKKADKQLMHKAPAFDDFWADRSGISYALLPPDYDPEVLFEFNKKHGSTPLNFIPVSLSLFADFCCCFDRSSDV